MSKPFESLLGNNCELRIIEFLLPFEGVEFNITELAREAGVSRPTADRVIKKFVEWGFMKISTTHGGTTYYELNPESPFLRLFEDFNNLIIERMLDDEELYRIHDAWQESEARLAPPGERQVEHLPIHPFREEQTQWHPKRERPKGLLEFNRTPADPGKINFIESSSGGDMNAAN